MKLVDLNFIIINRQMNLVCLGVSLNTRVPAIAKSPALQNELKDLSRADLLQYPREWELYPFTHHEQGPSVNLTPTPDMYSPSVNLTRHVLTHSYI